MPTLGNKKKYLYVGQFSYEDKSTGNKLQTNLHISLDYRFENVNKSIRSSMVKIAENWLTSNYIEFTANSVDLKKTSYLGENSY